MQPSNPSISSPNESEFPRRFGPYVLVSYLGEGGMGRVYLALTHTPAGEQLCVLKRFGNPRSRFSPEQLLENQERFRREAELTIALSHPCIARTFSSVNDGPQSYLVQEFIDGMTMDYLTSSLTTDGEHFSIPLAAHIATQIARALAYVHEFRGLGLVHRDLTPSNVMFAQSGEVKVIDFGIAKATLADDSLTRPHILVGKQFWTAPEVVNGQRVDRRADLYALGLLFWYLLSGRDPEGQPDGAGAVLSPPSAFNPEVSANLDAIVIKAIHPNPIHRFQTAAEFLDAVTPLIPAGYDGAKELTHQVFRYESALKKDAIASDVARARSLLEPATSTSGSVWKHKPLLFSALLALLAATAAATLGIILWPISKPTKISDVTSSRTPIGVKQSPSESPSPPAPSPGEAGRGLGRGAVSGQPPQPSLLPASRGEGVADFPAPASPIHKTIPRPTKTTHETMPQSDTPPQPGPDELMVAAMDSFEAENFPQALKLARAAAKQGGGAKAYVLIGTCLSLAKDYPAARAAFEHALRLSPGNAEAKRLLEQLRREFENESP
jgi:serine/threonine protein kinase